ncbi:hypothetical protein Pcinc_026300 [Petrolisthes cinctipes]|uniref:Uncharacterized protein n=1 Tax=Petrolisthes cinctipes TaxID=88211 RepID=A0AAE1F755_PETCI|nr:hypothetical protein Pcinc_026300 [Petrolisthes cinctipes]
MVESQEMSVTFECTLVPPPVICSVQSTVAASHDTHRQCQTVCRGTWKGVDACSSKDRLAQATPRGLHYKLRFDPQIEYLSSAWMEARFMSRIIRPPVCGWLFTQLT